MLCCGVCVALFLWGPVLPNMPNVPEFAFGDDNEFAHVNTDGHVVLSA